MIEIKPNLPEPPTYPTTLFLRTANGFLVKRWLFPRGIEVYNTQDTIIGSEYVVYTIE